MNARPTPPIESAAALIGRTSNHEVKRRVMRSSLVSIGGCEFTASDLPTGQEIVVRLIDDRFVAQWDTLAPVELFPLLHDSR
jgi:hypothetical protein